MSSTVVTEAGYVPGPWVGMAGARVWLLVDLDPADPVVASCWELVRDGSAVDALLNTLAGSQLRPALNIAVVRLDGRRAEVTVRGDAWADMSTADDGVVELRATPGGWGTRTIEQFTVVRLHGLGADVESNPSLPLGTGVVTAGRIVIRAELAGEPEPVTTEDPIELDQATEDGRPASAEASPAAPGQPAADEHGPAAEGQRGPGEMGPITVDGQGASRQFDSMFGPTTRPEPEPEYAAAVPADWSGLSPADAFRSAPPPGSGAGAAPPSATLPPEHTSAPADDGSYRSPFEGPFAGSLRPGPGTVAPVPPPPPVSNSGGVIEDVSWAIVPDDLGTDSYPYPTPHQPPAPTYPGPPPQPVPPYSAAPAPHASLPPGPPSSGAAYPSPYSVAAPGYAPAPAYGPSRPAPPYPGSPSHPAPAQPVHGGIDPELLQTTRRPAGPSAATGPVVSGVRCAVGHPNPPTAKTCRVCASPVPPQSPQPMPRPPLGVLRLSTGEVVPLDRGVVLGRAPGAPQGLGADEPHRIQLPSPDGSISRRHVEVVLDGWLVTVVDLNSTNGTVVTPAGGVSETLPSGGRKVIENGCMVNLDATTWFRFEVTQ